MYTWIAMEWGIILLENSIHEIRSKKLFPYTHLSYWKFIHNNQLVAYFAGKCIRLFILTVSKIEKVSHHALATHLHLNFNQIAQVQRNGLIDKTWGKENVWASIKDSHATSLNNWKKCKKIYGEIRSTYRCKQIKKIFDCHFGSLSNFLHFVRIPKYSGSRNSITLSFRL